MDAGEFFGTIYIFGTFGLWAATGPKSSDEVICVLFWPLVIAFMLLLFACDAVERWWKRR